MHEGAVNVRLLHFVSLIIKCFMEYIDMNQWKRKEHFAFFYRMDYPQFNICVNLDVTHFLARVRQKDLSFYYSMTYAVSLIANRVEEFRYRIRDGKVVLHEITHPSITDMEANSEDGLFKVILTEMRDNMEDFVRDAGENLRNQTSFFCPEKHTGRDDLIYITCLPWISFTHMSHTISLNKNDAVPRISWGKYFKEGDKVLLPFSVQVHHALMDGYHVGKYLELLQQYLDKQ